MSSRAWKSIILGLKKLPLIGFTRQEANTQRLDAVFEILTGLITGTPGGAGDPKFDELRDETLKFIEQSKERVVEVFT